MAMNIWRKPLPSHLPNQDTVTSEDHNHTNTDTATASLSGNCEVNTNARQGTDIVRTKGNSILCMCVW
jgi:hypothetical protein